jgi:hypothetical protein
MMIRLFHETKDAMDWKEVEQFDGGRICPSAVIKKNGVWYHYSSELSGRDEYFCSSLCYVRSDPPTEY